MFISIKWPFEWLLWISLIITIITNIEKEMVFGLRIRGVDIACCPPHLKLACSVDLLSQSCVCSIYSYLSINSYITQINSNIFVAHANLSNFIQSSVRAFISDPYNLLIICSVNICGSFWAPFVLSNCLCVGLWPHCWHWYLIQICAWPVYRFLAPLCERCFCCSSGQ